MRRSCKPLAREARGSNPSLSANPLYTRVVSRALGTSERRTSMDTIASLSLVDALVVIVVIGVAGAFLRWIYEHVVRFFSISSWRR